MVFIAIIYFVYLLVMVGGIVDEALSASFISLYLGGDILYFTTPHAIITSLYALKVKRSNKRFKSQMKRGLPKGLSLEEQEKWLICAYLFNKRNSKKFLLNEEINLNHPLAKVFTTGKDPFDFVQKTWDWSSSPSNSSNSSYSSSRRGGRSGGGGGGAGAR